MLVCPPNSCIPPAYLPNSCIPPGVYSFKFISLSIKIIYAILRTALHLITSLFNYSGFDLNRGVGVFDAHATVSELQYTIEVELEPYTQFTVEVSTETEIGRCFRTVVFISSEGG